MTARREPFGRTRDGQAVEKITLARGGLEAEILTYGGAVAALRVFSTPLRLALKVLANTLLGFGALLVLNLAAPLTGLSLGVNVLNALVIGVLGVPGLGLLLLTQWLFT